MPPASARMGPLAPTMPAPPPLPVQQPSRQAAFAQLPWRPPRTTCSKRQLLVRAGRSGTGTLPPESAHRWATMKTASMAQCRAQQPGPAHEPRGRCAGRSEGALLVIGPRRLALCQQAHQRHRHCDKEEALPFSASAPKCARAGRKTSIKTLRNLNRPTNPGAGSLQGQRLRCFLQASPKRAFFRVGTFDPRICRLR